MAPSLRIRPMVALGLACALSAALLGCTALRRLGSALYPSATPTGVTASATPEANASVTPTQDTPTQVATAEATYTTAPTFTSQPATLEPSLPAVLTPELDMGYALVYRRGGSLYRSQPDGSGAVEAAVVPQLETWAFRAGWLASAQGRAVGVIDLNSGLEYTWPVDASAVPDYAEIVWGAQSRALLHIGWVEDANSTTGRSVELRALSASAGRQLGLVSLPDPSGLAVLRYDDSAVVDSGAVASGGAGQVVLILYGADGAYSEVRSYDLASGALSATLPVSGVGAASLSPDGRYLLTQQLDEGGSRLALYDLTSSDSLPRTWDQTGEHSVSFIWSPDSQRVAFLLRTGLSDADAESQSLGVWVLESASLRAQQVLEETSLSSSLIGWTPDGDAMLGYHWGADGGQYYYTIRPDGSNRRILALPEDASVLGWMPGAAAGGPPPVVVDPWRSRFVAALGDGPATADLVAEVVATQSEVDDQALLQQITGYLSDAGWPLEPAGPSLRRVAASTFVVQLPPLGVYVIEPRSAQVVASGHIVLDARLVGDELGLVYGVIANGVTQPTYVLLRRTDGLWQTVWSPLGQRDWITTDGQVNFAGEGLAGLAVRGSSFGLDAGEDAAFSECQACPHRTLAAQWERQGDAYVRRSTLAADAPLADVLWEMTERTPYGVVHECIRRLRLGLPVDALVANDTVLAKLRQLGLDKADLRLAVNTAQEDRVSFTELTKSRHFTALVQGERVIHIEETR